MNKPVLQDLISLLVCILCAICFQTAKSQVTTNQNDRGRYRIMFYNTENFFDTLDDSLTADDDYTPEGSMHWTTDRYNKKLKNIYQVIMAVGEWHPPDIIGLCEIENLGVLKDLVYNTPLVKYKYKIVHHESPDRRGIDVALLYNAGQVKCLDTHFYNLNSFGYQTREILYFKALLGKDTCHFFVNHWPSRYGGQVDSETGRIAAAKLLRIIVDSLFSVNKNSKIVILGDFNDEYSDRSIKDELKALSTKSVPVAGKLYDLAAGLSGTNKQGTIKYQGVWSVFDQVIVSGSLLISVKGITTNESHFGIFNESCLLTQDEQYSGLKPYRTYNGYHYQGGFSDHLPVYIDLY